MLIPSIDLINGQAVQLRQGREHVLTAERSPLELAQEFNRYGEVAVIDLDAALNKGDNLALIKQLCPVADVRAGGGIRTVERGQQLLRAGAKKIIIGTAAEPEFLSHFPASRVMVALDHLPSGEIVDHGWTQGTGEKILDRAKRLAPYCSGFLCTFVEAEGGLQGIPLDQVEFLVKNLPHPVTVAGGVASHKDAAAACRLGADVQVGMALYTGKLDPVQAILETLDFEKTPLIPTIVQDEAGQVLMLAYSSPESLQKALTESKGIYFSRSRQTLWEKGATSGHTQHLLSCRMDCDRDTLLFKVRQAGPACHTNTYSCFGDQSFSIPKLFQVLVERKSTAPEGSYSAKLFQNRTLLLRKIMEEAYEVTISKDREELVWEISDALYFLSVLAVDEGLDWNEIVAELGGREK
jgi:phosphoribosyl-AMP cyclohydrolase / phosphoribosyl-ATP pyrophosphohydrolase